MADLAEQLEARKGCMRLSEFADFLAVSYDTIYKWVREYHLPATKIAGTYWIDPQLAARWWRNHLTTNAKPPAANRVRLPKASHVA